MNKEAKHINRLLSDWWSHITVHITLHIYYPPSPHQHSSHHTGYITPTHHPTVHTAEDTLPHPTVHIILDTLPPPPPPDQKARTDTHWTWRMQQRRGHCAGRGH